MFFTSDGNLKLRWVFFFALACIAALYSTRATEAEIQEVAAKNGWSYEYAEFQLSK